MPLKNHETQTSKLKHILLASALTFGIVGSVVSITAFMPNQAAAVQNMSNQIVSQHPLSFADMVDEVKSAVVSVKVKAASPSKNINFKSSRNHRQLQEFFKRFGQENPQRRQLRPRQKQLSSQGSGFFISSDGYVVTNHHVIENGSEFDVVLSDGQIYEAELIGSDAKTDLALLKVDVEDAPFKAVALSNNNPRVGDWVVAVGNPFGLGGTVTAGIVSAHGRELGASIYDDFIQIDAPVNKGNSGGPSFNIYGEVVGVNTAIFSPSGGNVGIAFAIPAETVKSIVEDLKEDGIVSRGWLGVQIQPLTKDLAKALSLPNTNGAMITHIEKQSPAYQYGLQVGDVILSVKEQNIENPKDLARTVGKITPGENAAIKLLRQGEEVNLSITLAEQEKINPVKKAVAKLENNKAATKLGLEIIPHPKGDGIIISNLDVNSAAYSKGLRQGQKIVAINGKKIREMREVMKIIERAKQKGDEFIVAQVENDQQSRFLALPFLAG